jgi:hypothetical protein
MRNWPVLLLLCLPAAAAENAAYDSNGRIIALLSDAEDVEVASSIVAVLPSGKRIPLQVRRAGIGATRQGSTLAWSMALDLPDGGKGRIELKSEEDAGGVRYTSAISAQTALEVDAIEFVLDAPRAVFLNGSATPEGAQPIPLASVRGAGPVLYRGDVAALHLRDATGALALDIGFDKPIATLLVDRWDATGRSFQTRAAIVRGPLASGATATLTSSLRLANTPATPAPARLVLDNSKPPR